MTKSEANTPETEQTAQVTEVPAPEMSAEEAATLTHEGEAALHDIGDDGLEPLAPFDIPAPGDVVVPFDKINEIVSEKQEAAQEAKQTAAPEKQEAEKLDMAPNKRGRRGKTVQQAAQEAKTEDTRKEPEEQRSEAEPKKERKPRMAKQKPTAEKKAPAKEEVPALEPAPPQEPKEAPRKGETEQIVYISLSELYAFKDHPFQVRDDEEMRAMVESVKDKGVTQPAIVRPREDGGYEIVSGHRRQKASELAG